MGRSDSEENGDSDASINAAACMIRRQWPTLPRVAVILGTGHGDLRDTMDVDIAVEYGRLPGFPNTTAPDHEGRLLCGRIAGVPAVVLSGRFHAYEGRSLAELTQPVRLVAELGTDVLIATNASGGLNPQFEIGDIMVVDDHIDFITGRGPHLRLPSENRPPRSASMEIYDSKLIDQALRIARQDNFAAHRGVYVAVTGPNYETRAETRFLRRIGADAVGMSTAPEATAAHAAGLRVVALSTITNVCSPDVIRPTASKDVIIAAESASGKLQALICGIVQSLGATGG